MFDTLDEGLVQHPSRQAYKTKIPGSMLSKFKTAQSLGLELLR